MGGRIAVGVVLMLVVACGRPTPASDHQLSLATSAGSVAEGAPLGVPGAPGEPYSFAGIARAVTPAVVSIETVLPPDTTGEDDQGGGVPPGLIPPGFRRQGPGGDQGDAAPRRALGSGFIVTSDGYLLTNNHVVADAKRVTVGLADRRIFPGHVVGRDPSTEVALVKIDAT